VAQQQTERFASTLSIDSNKTGSNSSGCKDYQSEYKKHFLRSRQLEVEVLPAVRKPDAQILESSDNGNKLDTYHSRLFCSPEVTITESITDSKLLFSQYNAQDCETTPEHVELPSQRKDAIPADRVPYNNNLQPIGQGPNLNSKESTKQQLPTVNVGNNNYNSPVTVAEVTDQLDDDQDGDVTVPQDASSSDNGSLMVISKGALQPVGGK